MGFQGTSTINLYTGTPCIHLGANTYSNSYFGDHLFPSGMYFNCFGNESSLSNCQTSTSTSCDFANTAGVYCTGEEITGIIL